MLKENTILYVDDEEPNLVAFRAIFRREYNIVTASGADEAIDIISNDPEIKVIISDNRMHGKTGIELFELVKISHPDPIRIILTGFADHNAMIDSINKAGVFRFLSKPWNEHDLRQTIESALEIYDTRRNLQLKQKNVEVNLSQLNRFIHSASNEMRSTLVSMHGIVRLVMNGDNMDSQEYLPLLEKGITQIDLQLRNIIDHYNDRKYLVSVEDLDLEQIAINAKETLASLVDLSNLNIRISAPSRIYISSDSYKLKLIFYNLLSFAFNNFSATQDVREIDIELSSTEDGAQIMFTDNGKIVESDLSDSIFDALLSEKGKNYITLYIVKDTINQLNGSLNIDTVPNAGTTYTITIPNQKANDVNSSS